MRCECGRKPVNDAGICESCHYHHKGVTVDAGSSQLAMVVDFIVHREVYGDKSLFDKMDKVYEELKWTAKEK